MNHQKGNRSSTATSYKTFVKYEPELAEELSIKKPKNCLVSGTLLSLVYQRLSFWGRYAKYKHNGKRYFWKSTEELGNEIRYSRKQVERAIKVLLELGMIIREKLNKRNWKQVYYYFLPHSPHTAEIEAPINLLFLSPVSSFTNRNSRKTRKAVLVRVLVHSNRLGRIGADKWERMSQSKQKKNSISIKH